jgi:hypothetical protein
MAYQIGIAVNKTKENNEVHNVIIEKGTNGNILSETGRIT